MKIIKRLKNVVLTGIDPDSKLLKFINDRQRVIKKGIFNEVASEWSACVNGFYQNESAIYIPKKSSLLSEFKESLIESVEKDLNYYPYRTIEATINSLPKDDTQREANDFLLGNNKYSSLANKPRKALFANTGSGKTFLTLSFICNKGYFTCINCPDNKALMTWKDEILKFTNIKEEEIAILSGVSNIENFKKKASKYKIVLLSARTISSAIIKGKKKVIHDFFKDNKFGLIVHDEVHLNLFTVFHIEMLTNNVMTLYLTATPNRSVYWEDRILNSLLPPENCIYQEEIVGRYHLIQVDHLSNPDPADIKGITMPGGVVFPKYSKQIMLNDKYRDYFKTLIRKVLSNAIKNFSGKDSKVAFGLKTKEECNWLYNYLVNEIKVKSSVGIFTSDIEDMDERFKETENRIIVSTEKSLNGIINIKDLESIILLHPISSEPMLLQICGRIRREKIKDDNGNMVDKNARIYILVDKSFKRISKMMNNSRRNLKEHLLSYEVVNLELNHLVHEGE